jgi:alpha-tubulin suppressor-like RCC1 family protein
VQISAGFYHTCALLSGGTVRCWGYNDFGQLGYGHILAIGDNEHPSTVGTVSLGATALHLSAGAYHTCALLSTGGIRCWGANGNGQLGYGHTNHIGDNELPTAMNEVGGFTNVLQVAAGGNHTCALLSTGGIRCWGYNLNGQLGLGNTSTQLAPPSTHVGLGGMTAYHLTAGGNHTCALLHTGKVSCWGLNGNGQLGYGHTNAIGDNELPVAAGSVRLLEP